MLARSRDAEAGPRRPRLRSRRFRGNTEARGRGPIEAWRMNGALPHAGDDNGASGPVAPDRPMFDLRARAIETVVLVASVVVLRVLGVLLLVISSYEIGSIDLLLPLLRIVADPNLLVWIALAAAVQFGLRSMRRPGRWALIVLAAPVAVLLTTAVRSLPDLAGAGLGAVLGNGIAWIDAGILTAVVALGIVFTAAFLGRERRRSAKIAGGLLALGGLLTLVLVWQAFETYFVLFGSEPVGYTRGRGPVPRHGCAHAHRLRRRHRVRRGQPSARAHHHLLHRRMPRCDRRVRPAGSGRPLHARAGTPGRRGQLPALLRRGRSELHRRIAAETAVTPPTRSRRRAGARPATRRPRAGRPGWRAA